MQTEKMKSLYIAIHKARDKLLENNAQEYFKPFADQYWYSYAIDSYSPFIEELTELFKWYEETVVQSIKLLDGPFKVSQEIKKAKKYLKDKTIKWANDVAETTTNVVKRQLVNGYEHGLSMYDITKNISRNAHFKISRAEKMTRTEIMSSTNYIDYANYSLTDNIVGYTWETCQDARVRPTHAEASGQYQPKGIPFNIGGHLMLCPGDQSLGAPASEIVQCRCWLSPAFKGDKVPKT